MRNESGGSSGEPSDTMRERGRASRLKLYLYLRADRRLVATIPLALLFVSIVGFGVLDPNPLAESVSSKDPVETLGQGLLTAIVTGVTLVVTINQLVLSRELGPLGDQRDRMEGALEFRDDVAELLDAPVAPPEPSAFLRALASGIGNRARAVSDAVDASTDGNSAEEADVSNDDAQTRVSEFADEVAQNADGVAERLDGRQFGTFEVLSAALDLNYSWKIYQARRLMESGGDELSDETQRALADLVDSLERFGPAREHIKTLYFRWELVDLSRAMFYTAIPALVASLCAVLFLDNPGSVPGVSLGVANLLWVVALITVVSLTPFAVLGSYVLRIATVAKRTLSIGPFVLRSETREDDLDWE
ncbi:hypothetical protein [Haloferax sp. KTX1]|uniref:hypothetical protein n=1 Tax=Haloferax sp. KTX1 TaxID=2600597 RepID=UPI0011DD7247|nr:hypothetical protein [Haloferax sp. KTX1]